MKKLICCLALIGLTSGCTQMIEHAAYVAPEDVPPAPELVPIQMGQTIDVAAPEMFLLRTRMMDAEIPLFNFYQFNSKPGQTVTITMRSKGGDTALSLLDSYGHENVQILASTTSVRNNEAARAARARGEHSEMIITLPPDEDGVYYIQPTMAQNGFSLTLQAGSVPAQDILKKP
ncbi:PPC domain-containing protein [Halopseudomonas nanhaiensis]|uniref:PPC domain-containing protein n=1 Tax=Halopseudomonas nanhaiensis TaxID=2830842 RepID=UPI001CBAE13F|nr:PPC domain-containing protein [Halopseudomonas nanhaiensis]UAW99457.1 PPC domain-containing protein [Halopseudomonas nanhaiensis]